MSSTVSSNAAEDWLWSSSAKALPLDTNSSRTIIVCTPQSGCQPILIIGDYHE